MSIVNKVLGLFLGNKYERDMKEINPHVELVHEEFSKVQSLTNDQLRDKTAELRSEIRKNIAADENEIQQLREKAEKEEDVYLKEEIYNHIDKLEKQIEEKLEDILDKCLPVAFAIVKETEQYTRGNGTPI
jgi:preprotein translocase subunit SecA